MDIEKCTLYAAPSKRPMPKKRLALISEGYALCFQQEPAALLNDNDNDAALAASSHDYRNFNALDNGIIAAALRLFGQYGLASAERAAQNAERCFWANDPLGHKWWMAVLRQLDNNLVARTQKKQSDGICAIDMTGKS